MLRKNRQKKDVPIFAANLFNNAKDTTKGGIQSTNNSGGRAKNRTPIHGSFTGGRNSASKQ